MTRLYLLRKKKGVPTRVVAEAIGIEPDAYYAYEVGRAAKAGGRFYNILRILENAADYFNWHGRISQLLEEVNFSTKGID